MKTLYRDLQSSRIRGRYNTSSFTSTNTSLDNSNVLIGNGTSFKSRDQDSQSPAFLILFGSFIVLFIVIPIGIEMYSYVTGAAQSIITVEENVYTRSRDSSKARRELINTSRLKMLLDKNSTILIEANYLPEQGILIDAIFPKGWEQMEAGICRHMEGKDDAATDASTIVADSSVSSHLWPIPECAICMESYNLGDSIVWSSNPDCHHVFHTACINEWLRRKKEPQWNCPYCRQPYF